MIAHFKRLTGQIFYYGLGDIATKLITVLILPIFARYLTPADFGVASILIVSTILVSGLADLGLSVSTYRFYYEGKDQNKFRLISTVQIFSTLITIIIAFVVIFFSQSLSQIFFKTSDYNYIIILAFLSIPLNNLTVAQINRLKLENKAKVCANIQITKALTDIIFKVILIIFLKHGINGLFEGQIINATIYAIIFIIYSLRITGFGFSYTLLKKMLRFGLPFAFSPIFFWILNWADRLILGRMTNMTEVGLYTLGYTVGMAVMLPVGAFTTAWPTFYMSVIKEPKAKKFFSLVLTYFSLIIGYFALLIIILSPDYFYFLTPVQFHSAYTIVPMVAFSYIFLGHYSIMITGTYLKRKTFYIFITEVLAIIINLGLLFLLVPRFGRIGAAWATLGSYFALPVIIYALTFKVFPIKYEYKRLIQILIAILIVLWINQFLYAPNIWNLFLRLLISLFYPLILLLMGFFEKTEIKLLKLNFAKYSSKIIKK
ncbi:MAG: Polysaccharide biosynthesis protein [Berkelbacteria bacterium GW2011_GWA1_36_9]|uniref:Polysaccharide biosynthesis protein n=1 Tax=Berkelbacteria bacterium GW2011_GWA1_36_9 TaxID=1618331 RepID=A0A0G0I3D4_9BACT|nr:MAG: Polysaccharide biosynthesis protein [Berkelbacteria bacterium GW2011_GWA1_36_9]